MATARSAPMLVLNPDELGTDPRVGMDLAVRLGIGHLEIRTVAGANAITVAPEQIRRVRAWADERGLQVAALASPLWKWCRPEATPGRMDSFGFPTRVPGADRLGWVERAIETAVVLGAPVVRVFSHLRVEPQMTERFDGDPLLDDALCLAVEAGVTLLLENEPVCTVAHTESLVEILDRYHEQGLGLWLDIANLHEVGQATVEAVRALAPYVRYVHVKDYRFDADGTRLFCAAGTGVVPYGEVLAVLDGLGERLPYGLETHVRKSAAEALAAGATFLRAAVAGRPE
ncbi:sugar phosphate isomerase/epimerase family protein [Nocardia sp. NPDC004068]|uniref:sugar phosphate isomerase/epimerase family protein n=1 Tax=Nocardia sp. NPDC004068 TaxID=3364303 RepID=UPI00369BEB77